MSQGATSNPARTAGSLALQNETRQTKSPMTNKNLSYDHAENMATYP